MALLVIETIIGSWHTAGLSQILVFYKRSSEFEKKKKGLTNF